LSRSENWNIFASLASATEVADTFLSKPLLNKPLFPHENKFPGLDPRPGEKTVGAL
jgi:hypothetical protein